MACKGHPDEFTVFGEDGLVAFSCTEKRAREKLDGLIAATVYINSTDDCEDFDCPRNGSCTREVTNTKEVKAAIVCNIVRAKSCPGESGYKCYLPKGTKIKSDCSCVPDGIADSASYEEKDYLIRKFMERSKLG